MKFSTILLGIASVSFATAIASSNGYIPSPVIAAKNDCVAFFGETDIWKEGLGEWFKKQIFARTVCTLFPKEMKLGFLLYLISFVPTAILALILYRKVNSSDKLMVDKNENKV